MRDYVSQDDNEGSDSAEDTENAVNSAAAQNNMAWCKWIDCTNLWAD